MNVLRIGLNAFMVASTGYLLLGLLSTSSYKSLDKLPNLPPVVSQDSNLGAEHSPILKLVDDHGEFFCSGFVISKNYAVTAAHCLLTENGLRKDKIHIYDQLSKNTGVVVVAAAAFDRMDLGLLLGDFSKFGSIPANPHHNEIAQFLGAPHLICGFPLNSPKAMCSGFIPTGFSYFAIIGQGHAVPGVSGGPALNLMTGTVDGVITGAIEDGVIVNSLEGLFSIFEIDNPWDAQ